MQGAKYMVVWLLVVVYGGSSVSIRLVWELHGGDSNIVSGVTCSDGVYGEGKWVLWQGMLVVGVLWKSVAW